MDWQDKGFSLAAGLEKGRGLPDWAKDMPILNEAESFYFKAFSDLSTCRISGFNVGQIPWTAIVQYAEINGLELELVNPFVTIIRAIDAAFIERVSPEEE